MGDNLYSLKAGFAKGFKNARKSAGYTQQSFADSFNVATVETIRNWEQGRNIPEIDTIDKLCSIFNCDLDYLFGRIDYKTHNNKFICETTGLSEEAVETLMFIKQESNDALPYGSYAIGATKGEVFGARKTSRVINEVLENEYRRFILNKKRGAMDNLLAAIDEYMHPLDFEFRVYDRKEKKSIGGKYKPTVFDRGSNIATLLDEEEIYRNIVMSRITKMLTDLRYDMDSE